MDARVCLARTYVWWQDPEVTLREPRKLLCQILERDLPADVKDILNRAAAHDDPRTGPLPKRSLRLD